MSQAQIDQAQRYEETIEALRRAEQRSASLSLCDLRGLKVPYWDFSGGNVSEQLWNSFGK
jgi:hypothetical protein